MGRSYGFPKRESGGMDRVVHMLVGQGTTGTKRGKKKKMGPVGGGGGTWDSGPEKEEKNCEKQVRTRRE